MDLNSALCLNRIIVRTNRLTFCFPNLNILGKVPSKPLIWAIMNLDALLPVVVPEHEFRNYCETQRTTFFYDCKFRLTIL